MDAANRQRGVLLAFFGMLGVSTDSYFIRLADVDGFDVTFWVGVLTTIVTSVAFIGTERKNPIRETLDGGWPLWATGALQAASTSFFVLAVTKTSVSNVVVIIAAAPIIAAGMSVLWLRERPSLRVWTAIAMVLAGILIVVSGSFGGGNLTGDLFAVAAISQFGTSLVILRRYPEINRTLMVCLGGFGMALIAVIPASIWGHEATTWLALILMGTVFGPVSRIMIAAAPRYLPAPEVGLFVPVETVAASVWAWLFFDEAPVLTTYIGGTIVLFGVLWGTYRPRGALA